MMLYNVCSVDKILKCFDLQVYEAVKPLLIIIAPKFRNDMFLLSFVLELFLLKCFNCMSYNFKVVIQKFQVLLE